MAAQAASLRPAWGQGEGGRTSTLSCRSVTDRAQNNHGRTSQRPLPFPHPRGHSGPKEPKAGKIFMSMPSDGFCHTEPGSSYDLTTADAVPPQGGASCITTKMGDTLGPASRGGCSR